ncbi:GntR family transcriptional regulator [Marinoscillum furvescens]|uniref:Regulatory GntR family protein n=1 Tax=Marinoscillum furvescens DSM 4134 TaxID=1122208 RepID=A0A3D9KX43_MARFU|nr:winged helix-turn-helix domain-containing protein [Marinoscillum furvescens]RED92014.1 regulatory GntR family protein [Marinoscillum furvescens DSM 4134]
MMNTSANLTNQQKPFDKVNFLKIDDHSLTPKYMQIVEIILSDIENGIFKIGEQIPSINETSAEFYMARDTVEKAYRVLRQKGIITSVKRKGYFVASTGKLCTKRILMVLNQMNEEHRKLSDTLIKELPTNWEVDINFYNGQLDLLQKCLMKNKGHYDHFVVVPDVKVEVEQMEKVLDIIPNEKMLLVKASEEYKAKRRMILQHGKDDLYDSLAQIQEVLSKYEKAHFVMPDKAALIGFVEGFVDFCSDYKWSFEVQEAPLESLQKGGFYLVWEEEDLRNVIQLAEQHNYQLGKDIGVISFNDTCLKEVLCGGITVLTPEVDQLAKNLSQMLMDRHESVLDYGYKIILRNSL